MVRAVQGRVLPAAGSFAARSGGVQIPNHKRWHRLGSPPTESFCEDLSQASMSSWPLIVPMVPDSLYVV